MKLSLLIIAAALWILVFAFQNPSLFFIGYLWTTVLYPNAFAETFVSLSLIFGAFSLLGYFLTDRSNRAPFPLPFYLAIAFAIWVTITTFTAVLPDPAWTKWTWAIESILIVIATPLFLRTRVQVEAGFICVFAAMSAHIMTAGIKTVFGTGGYDRLGRLMMTNFWLGETSTLALAAVISLPMVYYIARHSIIFSNMRGRLLYLLAMLYAFLALMCVVGTSARTGVVTLGAFLLIGIPGLWRKAVVVLAALGLYFGASWLLPGKTMQRYETIGTYQQDDSAQIRLGVWRWAYDYANAHPWGGGFGVFKTSSFNYDVDSPTGDKTTRQRTDTAPHSIFFEVLGEQGYFGAGIYVMLLGTALFGLFRITRMPVPDEDTAWRIPFARSLVICIVLFMVGGSFVGIAFQPMIYVFLGFYCSLYRIVHARVKGVSDPLGVLPDASKTRYA